VNPSRLPDFLIIGAQKAGTTWLREQLRAHPDVFMPAEELHFFDHRHAYEKGAGWYADQFAEGADCSRVGDKTPEYLYLSERADIPEGPRRIHDLLPDARLIVVLRDPVTRALSAINHLVNEHYLSPLQSVRALLLGRKRRRLPWPVIEMGMYARQLAPFLELYGEDSVLALFYEDEIVGAPEAGIHRVCDFLEIRRQVSAADVQRHPNRPRRSTVCLAVDHYAPALSRWTDAHDWRFPRYYPRLSRGATEQLYALYEPANERLFELLGRRPASGWSFAASERDREPTAS